MDIIEEFERLGSSADFMDLVRQDPLINRLLMEDAERVRLAVRPNVCCGIYAPEDDPPVPEEEA